MAYVRAERGGGKRGPRAVPGQVPGMRVGRVDAQGVCSQEVGS